MYRKRRIVRVTIIVLLIVMLISAFGYACNHYILWMYPKNSILSEIVSPNGKHVLRIYDTSGGATSAFSIGAEVADVNGNFKKILYRAEFEQNHDAFWIDDLTVSINGVSLDIRFDTFSCTRLNSIERRKNPHDPKAIVRTIPDNVFEKFIDWVICYH